MDESVRRRLLLSREFFAHALSKSQSQSGIDKMMAIHNFHIAVEIALRAIMLHHQIRQEKTLNIEFETMLSEIDNHGEFKRNGQKLPYRQELRTLNQQRNLVQHHAVEPEVSSMEDARVFVRRFLTRAFQEYFSVNFDSLSRISFVRDDALRNILELARKKISEGASLDALDLGTAAFE